MSALKLVLDTNVVLDWLVFEDAGVATLRQGIADRRIAVITYELALAEFRRVLSYPQLQLEPARREALFETYRATASIAKVPDGYSRTDLKLPAGFPRCRDPDDDHFLALTHHAAADALVSKDKAVLKLRRRARKFGVTILDLRQLEQLAQIRH
ncbi:MAG TPA: putative toxin-antitoxin system toxin component, PIN family [Steroidobacteraceae bacterium]|jgi:putative PIN family toxin of toxin-antitoxin system|nr:putative toxin-antitoxin system toxin component, PIN family [Steroidobacteraceae bacterium]